MQSIDKLLLENKAWAAEKKADDPEYFRALATIQTPEFLWIGCSDSRVPANEITGTQPGEIFVHRNIANMVIHTDVNLLSVLEYAVAHIKVKHVIVCGHYGCGGIKAAMTNHDFKQVLNMWLRNIKDVYRLHREELEAISNQEEREDRLTELNVQEQVLHLAKTSIIQRAWQHRRAPDLHGLVYGLKDGLLNTIFTMTPESSLDPLYTYDDLGAD
jgi:carbonic anhydrase